MEIYYDPYFYSLELLIESAENSEGQRSSFEMEHYKSSKSVKVELEEGRYTVKILAKHPAGHNHIPDDFIVKYYEFQLYMAVARRLKETDEYPEDLNMFGLLGPEGKDFGQCVYYVPSIDFGPSEGVTFEYDLRVDAVTDVQAVDERGHGDLLKVSLGAKGATAAETKKRAAHSLEHGD
jgi:hypothetical protein